MMRGKHPMPKILTPRSRLLVRHACASRNPASSFSMARKRKASPGPASRHAQRGAVLVVALIFLLLLTMLALSATGRSLLQERMAGGLRNAQQAEMGADSALRGAEWRLWTSTSKVGGHLDCQNGQLSSTDACVNYSPGNPPYEANGTVTKFLTSQGWVDGVGKEYTGTLGSDGYTSATSDDMRTAVLAKNPRYIIEDMGREMPPGSGPQHESGDTGPNNNGPGQINIHVYRITARATGASENTVRVLQSTFDAQATN
jgi:type IV pilus assembly protein PilX